MQSEIKITIKWAVVVVLAVVMVVVIIGLVVGRRGVVSAINVFVGGFF